MTSDDDDLPLPVEPAAAVVLPLPAPPEIPLPASSGTPHENDFDDMPLHSLPPTGPRGRSNDAPVATSSTQVEARTPARSLVPWIVLVFAAAIVSAIVMWK